MYMNSANATVATVCPKTGRGLSGLGCAMCASKCGQSSGMAGLGDFSILGAVAGSIMGGMGRAVGGGGAGGDTTVVTTTNVNTNVSPQISPNFQQSSGSGSLVASSSQAAGGPDLGPYLPTPTLPVYGGYAAPSAAMPAPAMMPASSGPDTITVLLILGTAAFFLLSGDK